MTAFDPGAYKETTRAQWQDAASAWHRWDPVFDRWLGPATERMLDLAGVREGTRVVDIAAGSGGQSIAAARRGATVLATDISSNILDEAAEAVRAADVTTITTRVVDAEELDVEPGSFDAAISRLGLMYMPDKPRALAQARRALREGGRYAAVVFAEPERNGFFSLPIGIIRRRAQLPPPAPGLPGPFSCATLADQLEAAGLRDVEVHRVDAPLELSSAAECTQLERESFGALHQMLAGLSEEEREDTWREIEAALGEFETAHGFRGPCELLVGAGTNCGRGGVRAAR
jgi:SAM-dependent methyltransferase